ncbi:MAG: serine/threonine dehydratase [Acidobacteria bacterium]|nr:MAG: serine/threonine dehydratase [Acidobacteriota bacterium]
MIDLNDIRKAAAGIGPYIEATPLRASYYFSERCGFDVYLKLENVQPTGSFKVRGALNLIRSIPPQERMQGIVAWSAGNHALGVAYAAQIFDVPATIFVPRTTPHSKLDKLRRFPVEIRIADTYEQAEIEGKEFAIKEKATIVHPYDDWRTVAGQGTIGLELCERMPELDAIVVPVGGGGLISGIAIAARELDSDIRIIAVQTDASPSLPKSLEDQKCYETYPVSHSIAEGLAGGIGRIVYELAPKFIDEILVVEEEEVAKTVLKLLENEQLVVEASGAASVAALPLIESVPRGSRVAVVISGGNLNMKLLRELLS